MLDAAAVPEDGGRGGFGGRHARNRRSVAVVGCGVNGADRSSACSQRWRRTPLVCDRDAAARERAVAAAHGGDAVSLATALEADAVIAVTPGRRFSSAPVPSYAPARRVSLMGADGPGKAEESASELTRAHLFCNKNRERLAPEASSPRRSSSDRSRGRMSPRFGAVLAETAKTLGRTTSPCSTRRAFPVQDLAVAIAAYSKAAEFELQTDRALAFARPSRQEKAEDGCVVSLTFSTPAHG